MAKRKSSLDNDEPLMVEGEEKVKEPIVIEEMATGKADAESAVVENKNKQIGPN